MATRAGCFFHFFFRTGRFSLFLFGGRKKKHRVFDEVKIFLLFLDPFGVVEKHEVDVKSLERRWPWCDG